MRFWVTKTITRHEHHLVVAVNKREALALVRQGVTAFPDERAFEPREHVTYTVKRFGSN